MPSHTVQIQLGTLVLFHLSYGLKFSSNKLPDYIFRSTIFTEHYGLFLNSIHHSFLQTDHLNVKSYLTRFCPSNSQVLDGSTSWLPVALKQNKHKKKVKLQSTHTRDQGVTAAEEVQSAAPGL